MRTLARWSLALIASAALISALLLALRSTDGLEAASWVAAVAAALAIVVSLLRWAYRASREATSHTGSIGRVEQALGLLAEDVFGRWSDEIALWQLDDPKLATRWLWGLQGAINTRVWTSGNPQSMALLSELVSQLPRQRIAIVGGSGMGKTSLVALLVRHMTRSRPEDALVPVPFSATRWTLKDPDLSSWVSRLLAQDFPRLRSGELGIDMPKRLVAGRSILPIIDGLDELDGAELRTLTQALAVASDDDHLILTSRPESFKQLPAQVRRSFSATLTAAPITATALLRYLREFGVQNNPEWQPLLANIREQPSGYLASALNEPLLLWLLRAQYIETGKDPKVLTEDLNSKYQIREILLDGLIPALLGSRPSSNQTAERPFRPRRDWATHKVQRWLRFAAATSPGLSSRVR